MLIILAIVVAVVGLGTWLLDRQGAAAEAEVAAAVDRLAVAAAGVDASDAWTLQDETFADLARAVAPARLTAEWSGPQERAVFRVVASRLGTSACRHVTAQPRDDGGFEVSDVEVC